LKRIILLVTLVALTVSMLALSSLASSAQEDGGQYSSNDAQQQQQSPSTTIAAPQSTVICAPWSKAWDISKGQWYFDWYRWCVDPSLYDPALESSWYTEGGNRVLGEQANLCPERGTCTISPDGGMSMSTSKEPADTQPPPTSPTTSPSPTPSTDSLEATQTPTSLP
jgi:hypothetical protein